MLTSLSVYFNGDSGKPPSRATQASKRWQRASQEVSLFLKILALLDSDNELTIVSLTNPNEVKRVLLAIRSEPKVTIFVARRRTLCLV